MKKIRKNQGSIMIEEKTGKGRRRREILLLMTGVELSAIVTVERRDSSAKIPFRTAVHCKALEPNICTSTQASVPLI